MSYLVTLLTSLLLMLLIAIPYIAQRWAKRNRPSRTGVLTLASIGLAIYSASIGLYLFGFLLPVFGMPLALIGGAIALLHGTPGYELSINLGILQRGVVVHGNQHIWQHFLSGVVWGIIYGMIGFIFDQKLWRFLRWN